jgi:hypothetical protein
MAATDHLSQGRLLTGIAIGVGVALLAPVALAALGGAGRPAARAAVKAGLLVYEKGRETLAELAEIAEDLAAEAQADLERERAEADAPEAAPETAAPRASEEAPADGPKRVSA